MAYRGESRPAGAAPAKSEQFCISQAEKPVRGQGVGVAGGEAGQMQPNMAESNCSVRQRGPDQLQSPAYEHQLSLAGKAL